MNINLTNNPFVVPANKLQSTETLPVETSNRTKPEDVQTKALDSQKVVLQPTQTKQLFSLSPRQSRQLTDLQNRESGGQTTNQPISQYLQTESLAKREEIESLVGLDVFA